MSEQLNDYRGEVTAPSEPGDEERLSSRREELFRDIFEECPVAIWVEDWSRGKTMIDGLARRGVTNWRRYFERHPDQLITIADLCDTVEVSRASLDMYRTRFLGHKFVSCGGPE